MGCSPTRSHLRAMQLESATGTLRVLGRRSKRKANTTWSTPREMGPHGIRTTARSVRGRSRAACRNTFASCTWEFSECFHGLHTTQVGGASRAPYHQVRMARLNLSCPAALARLRHHPTAPDSAPSAWPHFASLGFIRLGFSWPDMAWPVPTPPLTSRGKT